MSQQLDISVVIPLFNEDESLPELVAWIERVMTQHQFTYEIVMVDDGSKDNSWKIIEELQIKNPNVRGIKFRRNYGKSAALYVGFDAVRGDVVITMDADLQDSPEEIPGLRKLIVEDGYDVVSGWKKKRHDPISKTIPTKLFNWATRKMSGIYLHDFNCGLKAYKKDVVKSIEVYGEMHRYIPVIAKAAGFNKIGEKVVQHQARKYGHTKFGGWNRFINGLLDLMSIYFMSRFGKRPMHFFGSIGTILFSLGFIILLYFFVDRIFLAGYGATDRPLFFMGIVCLLVGSQMFLAGFLGELIARNASDRNAYLIETEI